MVFQFSVMLRYDSTMVFLPFIYEGAANECSSFLPFVDMKFVYWCLFELSSLENAGIHYGIERIICRPVGDVFLRLV